MFTLFIFREKYAKDPMLHLGLFDDIDFSLVNLATMFSFLFYAGNLFLLPFYLILVKGLNSARAGLVILIYSLIYMVLSPYLGRLSDRIKPRYLCTGGMLLAAVACILFVMTIKTAGLACVAIYLVILSIAYSFFIPPNNTQAMNLAPEEKQGVASGAFTMIKNLALVLGVGIFETVFSSSIPHKIAAADTGKAFANIPHDMLYAGFRRAYILGMFLCLISAVLSYLAKKNT